MSGLYLFCVGVVVLGLASRGCGYSTYPRRYNRDSVWGTCPQHCRCMTLNSRGTRGLLDTWGEEQVSEKTLKYFSGGINDEAARNGRSMVCQGLRTLPDPIPADISKLTIFGDSSGSGQGKTDVIEDTRIKTLERRSFRGNMRLKEITMSGNNLGILYPYVFYHLRDLKILNLPNNNIRHMSAAAFHGLFSLHELNLSDNMIRFLPTPVFNYLRELRSVNLNGNKIRAIQRNMFRALGKLEKLDLSRNNITDMYDDTFRYNSELTELYLSGNRLWKLRPEWFQTLPKLKSLSLRGNMIKTVEPNTFTNLPNLKELLLSANMIQTLKDGAFKNLKRLDILDVSTNDLTTVPTSCFEDLQSLHELYLGKNKLSIIRNGTFSFGGNLKRLDLSGNLIDTVEREALYPINQVHTVDFSKNKIRVLTKDFINGLHNLQDLNFADNFIEDIEESAFIGAVKLSQLNLKSNNLSSIGQKTFEPLTILKSLDLGHNKISNIHPSGLSTLRNLRSLNINDNKLPKLEGNMFLSLFKLLELDVSNNRINELSNNSFVGLHNLEDLDLESNNIHTIAPETFRSLPRIVTLDLKGNKLISFNFSVISELPYLSMVDLSENKLFNIQIGNDVKLRLTELSLSKNNLKELSERIKRIMSSSSLLLLDGNPWTCNCKAKWLKDPMLSRQIRVHSSNDVICKSPNKLHGKKLFDLTDKDLSCQTTKDRNSTALQMCEASTFVKKRWYTPRSVRKALLSRHATIVDDKGAPIVNGIMVSEDWVLTIGTRANEILQSTNPNSVRVKVGRTKGYRNIVRTFVHPLVQYGSEFNVALLRLRYHRRTPDQSCIISSKQYSVLTSIFKHIIVTTRMTGKTGKFAKLKPRKGRISKPCSQKNLICATIKRPKRPLMLMEGSPMYLGHNGDYRLAGIGVNVPAVKDYKYDFIPLWSVSDWVQDVLDEYNAKCHFNSRGVDVCEELSLPTLKDMEDRIRRPEQH